MYVILKMNFEILLIVNAPSRLLNSFSIPFIYIRIPQNYSEITIQIALKTFVTYRVFIIQTISYKKTLAILEFLIMVVFCCIYLLAMPK